MKLLNLIFITKLIAQSKIFTTRYSFCCIYVFFGKMPYLPQNSTVTLLQKWEKENKIISKFIYLKSFFICSPLGVSNNFFNVFKKNIK